MHLINALIYSNKPSTRILRHTLFWVTDIIFYFVVTDMDSKVNRIGLYHSLLKLLLVIPATYFILYYLIPLYLKPGPKGKAIAWTVVVGISLSIGVRYFKLYVFSPIIDPLYELKIDLFDIPKLVNEVLQATIAIGAAVVIKLMKNEKELHQKNEQLILEKKIAELNFLKAQMHPHFLFNTLNTLYSETIQESDKAQKVVLHLSDLLRFILDDCDRPLIPLQKEIKVIHDFIELEKLRHGTRLNVIFTVTNVDLQIPISPLLFLPFVENSFKHTLRKKRGLINITIEIRTENDMIHLTVENDNAPEPANRDNHLTRRGNINAKSQLDLLYGDTYTLLIKDGVDKYSVSLQLPTKQIFYNVED